ncbi:hypothetical protein CTAM01_03415, partial [Colletotrichum tamarilloi]
CDSSCNYCLLTLVASNCWTKHQAKHSRPVHPFFVSFSSCHESFPLFPSWHPYFRAFPFYAFRFVSFMPDAFRVSLILRGGLGCRRKGWHGMACHRTCYSVLRTQCLRHCPSPSKLPLKGQTKDKVGMKTFSDFEAEMKCLRYGFL